MSLPADHRPAPRPARRTSRALSRLPASTLPLDPEDRLLHIERASRRTRRTAGLVILVFFVGFGGWAALAPLKSAVVGSGVFTFEGNRKTIQHLEGGIVREILHHDGDHVKAGDVLIQLDDTRARATAGSLRVQFYTALALQSRLTAERDDLKSIRFADELLANTKDPAVEQAMSAQTRVFEARERDFKGQVAVLKQQIGAIGEQIAGLRVQIAGEARQSQLLQEQIKDQEYLFSKGLTQKSKLLELKRAESAIEGSRGSHVQDVARAQQQIGETEMKILSLGDKLFNDTVQELAKTQSAVGDLRDRLSGAEDVLERTKIRAPIDGIVFDSQVHTVRGVIAPGEEVMAVAPGDQRLIIECKISPKDIETVHSGMDAQIQLTAIQRQYTPTIDGKVIYVSADLVKPSKADVNLGSVAPTAAGGGASPADAAYYRADIEVSAEGLKSLNATITPGMPAQVMIATGSRTMLEYLMQPLLDRFARSFVEQ
jgi:epimerase transport system membrane fusion protein